ncbi:hypothetical protein SAPIO_CDS5101 [Scedosporium apiospermum]|uniref:Uncharacterized protein n=1 Tax=Pseudallescheria apiosperma TaxID=563466 RepID=A0A084G6R5_PSEDA|nr:uncharacterized protein SAPIO_CDS5101 [Scedosporium apiospermum]KEZ43027.1 hypothetical protein SAPIO_CDS5101 [Scedosporium apiospermum]
MSERAQRPRSVEQPQTDRASTNDGLIKRVQHPLNDEDSGSQRPIERILQAQFPLEGNRDPDPPQAAPRSASVYPQTNVRVESIPVALTQENLGRLDKTNSTRPAKSTPPSRPPTEGNESASETTSTPSSFPSDFEMKAIYNGVLDRMGSKLPKNLEDERTRLDRSRLSPPPPESEWLQYLDAAEFSPNKATLMFAMPTSKRSSLGTRP